MLRAADTALFRARALGKAQSVLFGAETGLPGVGGYRVGTLNRLKAPGVKVATDDFGTGYSSLPYPARFPVGTVKRDRPFAAQLGENPASAAITEAVVTFARTLGLAVVAEGVKKADQLARVKGLGCPYGRRKTVWDRRC